MPSAAALPLDAVIATSCLRERPRREPDPERESRITLDLVEALARDPASIYERLVDAIVDLCGAHSAGISLLDPDGTRFLWPAVAGQWARYVSEGTSRDFGPCGTVLDRDALLLFQSPERHFTYLQQADPPIVEGLLVPFHIGGQPVGTIWAISHGAGKVFDAEDARLLRNLSGFTSRAYKALRASGSLAGAWRPDGGP